MNEICNYFNVIPEQEANDFQDGFVVEKCSTFDQGLRCCIVCYQARVDELKGWIKNHCMRVADYVCGEIDAGRGSQSMRLLASTLQISSFTHEFVTECGGVQEFLDKYGKSENEISFGTPEEPKEVEVKEYRESEDNLPTDAFISENDEMPADAFMFEDTDEDLGSEVTEDEPKDILTFETEVEDEQDATVVGEPEKPVATESADKISLPSNLFGENASVPLSQLVECANYINAAAAKLETSEIADTYILLKDDVEFAVNYVSKYSPSIIKSFFEDYIRSAESDVEFIRITKMLDAFAKYVTDKCDNARKVVGDVCE